MRIAVVHEWLVTYAGSERVLEQILAVYPNADVFAVCDFLPDSQRAFLCGKTPRTTFVQRLPLAARRYRSYLPLMPLAVEQLDLSDYDLVISSHHAVAKGVITGPDQLHVSYVHSPARYAWDLQHQYLRESNATSGVKSLLARAILHRFRIWDRATALGVDDFIANSRFVARRIHKAYRRDSTVIYPPVDTDKFQLRIAKDAYYLVAARMVPYKRIPLIVESFSKMPGRRLVVVGDGPELSRVKALASSNVDILPPQSGEQLCELMQNARAFVFAAEEDFGISCVEAQSCGTPVIALGKGGSLETVRGIWADALTPPLTVSALSPDYDNPTGIFFRSATTEAIINAVHIFEKCRTRFDPVAIRMHAATFSIDRFRHELARHVSRLLQ